MELHQMIQYMTASFKEAGVETSALDTKVLLKERLNLSDVDLITGGARLINPEDQSRLEEDMRQRCAGQPVSKILGFKEFWSLRFKVSGDTLDPRPDTETLVETALTWARTQGSEEINILDLGTGTGCIVISLLHELSKARGTAIDISEQALAIAKENAKTHAVEDRITFTQSNWTENLKTDVFDLIVSNPPYIKESALANLAIDVQKYDPILALQGGEDGLNPYKILFPQIKSLLKPCGKAFFEIGADQSADVMRLIEDSGLTFVGIWPDIAGRPRVVEISHGEK